MQIKEIMTEKIISVDANITIFDACKKFKENKIGCLLVNDGDDLVGIVTERDIIKRTICEERDSKNTLIKDIMSTDIKTIEPHEKVENALRIFKEHNIKKLPVVTNDRIVGIVTITDIAYTRPGINKFVEQWKSEY